MSLNRESDRGRGREEEGEERGREGGSNTEIKKFLQKSGGSKDDKSTKTRMHYE